MNLFDCYSLKLQKSIQVGRLRSVLPVIRISHELDIHHQEVSFTSVTVFAAFLSFFLSLPKHLWSKSVLSFQPVNYLQTAFWTYTAHGFHSWLQLFIFKTRVSAGEMSQCCEEQVLFKLNSQHWHQASSTSKHLPVTPASDGLVPPSPDLQETMNTALKGTHAPLPYIKEPFETIRMAF